MGIAQWWSRRSQLEQALLIGVPGVGLGVLGAFMFDRKRRLEPGGFTPYEELPDLLDYESDEVDELPPPDIEYDPNDAPCIEEPEVVAIGLEGAGESQFCTPPADLEPRARTEVAFAKGGARPQWPLDTNARRKLQVSYQDVRKKWHGRWGREFGASRKSKSGGKRNHVGVDLFADPGDIVVAMEDGEVLAGLPFYKGTGAVYLLTDSGLIINYGELERWSWRNYGVRAGTRVQAGDQIGRVGLSNDGSHMLHLETYQPDVTVDEIRNGAMQWWKGDPAPEGILDPTRYLVRAQRVHHEDEARKV